jgi:hypothetical protein
MTPLADDYDNDLILRSRAKHGVSKDGPQHRRLPTLRDGASRLLRVRPWWCWR